MGSQLDALYEIAVSAGQAIMARYHGQVQIAEKADHSPVTEADLAANAIILEGLAALTPDIPVLSEESEHSTWEARQSWERFWLVDPLDGTKEFLRKNGEFTVNIALIEQGKPVMAVVHAPALNKSWLGNGKQAWLVTKAGKEPIKTRPATVPTVVAVVLTRVRGSVNSSTNWVRIKWRKSVLPEVLFSGRRSCAILPKAGAYHDVGYCCWAVYRGECGRAGPNG